MIEKNLLLSKTDIAKRLGYSRPTVYRIIKSEKFPSPVKIPGVKNERWLSSDVEKWVSESK